MKIFLDTNVPHPLSRHLVGYETITAQRMGWGALENGDLLRAVEEAGFAVFVTADQNLRYQQNLAGRKIALLILPTNHLASLKPLAPAILTALSTLQSGDFVEISAT